MACLVAVFALGAPRFVFLMLVVFSDYIGRAFDGFLFPLLGFFCLPLTTMAYAWSVNSYGGLRDLGLLVTGIALLFDLGIVGNGRRAQRRRLRSG